jgi:hypothetical protein
MSKASWKVLPTVQYRPPLPLTASTPPSYKLQVTNLKQYQNIKSWLEHPDAIEKVCG